VAGLSHLLYPDGFFFRFCSILFVSVLALALDLVIALALAFVIAFVLAYSWSLISLND
jgi:hypothetical protein